MPKPPDPSFQLQDLFCQLRCELLQEMQAAQKESLDAHRVLIQCQEASLQKMLMGVLGQSQGVALVSNSHNEQVKNGNVQIPVSPSEKGALANLPALKEVEEVDEGFDGQMAQEIGAAGVRGRGATWVADQDRTTNNFQVDKKSLHHTSGICVAIADSHLFHAISMVMICANAVYLGIEADWNSAKTLAEADWGFQVCEQTFCTFFTFELIMRFGAFKHKSDCRKDGWFVLDFFMVVLMMIETWFIPFALSFSDAQPQGTGPVGGIGRLLRLLRLTRISKLMTLVPELVTMVKGMIAAIRAVHAALLILILLVYVFAIMMNALVGEEVDVHAFFGSVRGSMVTLILQAVLLDDISGLTRALIAIESVPGIICLSLFVLLSALTVMNMLIGVLCQVVIDVSADEKEHNAKAKMSSTLFVMLQNLDADNSGQLSKAEVQSVIHDPGAIAIMNDIQVDTQYLLDISEMLFTSEDSTLPISIFMNIVLTLRGKRPPTMNDIAKGHNLSMWAMETQLTHHRELMKKALREILDAVQQGPPSNPVSITGN